MNWNYLQSVIVAMAVLVFFVAAVIFAGAWVLARFSRKARAEKLQANLQKAGDSLIDIPLDTARRLALDRLAMSPDFEVVRAAAPCVAAGLGPGLRALLDSYEEIHYLPDNSFVARAAIAAHNDEPAWLRIGKDGEADWLLARVEHDEVAVWDGETQEHEQRLVERYPSIYHWLISLVPV